MRIVTIKQCLCIILLTCFCKNLLAQQYTVNGDASQNACNEYTLTSAFNDQSGSVWNNIKIDLTQSFDFKFDVFLGNNDGGADGIAFVLQPLSTSEGSSGGGLGYNGITPAVGVTIDTYQNGPDNDPVFDHIAIQLNGDLGHTSANNIAGPVTAINGNNNIEDATWHSLRIVWDAATTTFSAYVDGSLRVSVVKDFVSSVFGGNPMVYWGFTGSTGGLNNYQAFKTALNPTFTFNAAQKRCVNEPITFNNTTISFTTIAKFYWNFGDGSPIDSVNFNPVHVYATGGDYSVIQRIIGADGCEAINTQMVRVGTKPTAYFKENFRNCIPMPLNPSATFVDSSYATVGTVNSWYWHLDEGQFSNSSTAVANYTTAGNKNLKLAVKTLEGCESDTLYKTVPMYSNPVIDFTFTDSVCLGSPMNFFGNVISSSHPITNWSWVIDGQAVAVTQNTTYTFTTPGIHTVLFMATSSGSASCLGIRPKPVFVVNKPTAYFKHNTICEAAVTTFTDSSYTSDGTPVNQWWWSLGNTGGIATGQNPPATFIIAGNDTIKMVVHNSKGCASDTLKQPIVIHAKPVANFGYGTPLCDALPVQFSDSSKVSGADVVNKWSWLYSAAEWSTVQNPVKTFAGGTQTVQLIATSNAGCNSNPVDKTFFINASPDVTINFKDACKNAVVNFTATDNSGTVTQWNWVFGDGGIAGTQNAQHVYNANGTYNVKLFATAANGCYSGALSGDIVIYSTNVFAGNDTIAAAGQPVQLNATGGLSYSWSPAFDLNNPNIANPITILNATQTFTVKAFTPEGCESFDDVVVKIYKGPDIYLPNAFTPNGDTRNDVLKGTPVGIKQFNYLKIYNRWGQMIFYTTDYNTGWNGLWKGQKQNEGSYIAMVSAVDFKGNKIEKKQSIMLIR